MKKMTSPMAKNALCAVDQSQDTINMLQTYVSIPVCTVTEEIHSVGPVKSHRFQGLTSDDLRDSIVSGNEACPAL